MQKGKQLDLPPRLANFMCETLRQQERADPTA